MLGNHNALSQQKVLQRNWMTRASFCASGNVGLKNDLNSCVSGAHGKRNLCRGKEGLALLISYLNEQSMLANKARARPSSIANAQRNLLAS
jgi:hypothetical protein